MRKLMAILSLLLVAGTAHAEDLRGVTQLPKSGEPGYTVDLTASNAAGTYVVGSTFPKAVVGFDLGSAFAGTLYACETKTYAAGTCDALATAIDADFQNVTFNTTRRWYLLTITTPETGSNVSRLTIFGSFDVGGGGVGTSPFDACRSGSTKGGGYNTDTGRYAWTCGNYNWHGWRDSTQATASYSVTCTGDGTPHTSCIHDGEVRLIGYPVHRTALAAQYTRDGGRVYLPAGLYVDNGALYLEDGVTRAKYPSPYNPEWESRSDFVSLGYPTRLEVINLNRGVRLIGEGIPTAGTVDLSDSDVSANRPRLSGTWIVDDRGTAVGTPGLGNTATGETGIISPISQYRILVGGNVVTSYCHTTDDDDPTCVTDIDQNAQDVPNGANVWGADFSTLANFDATVGTVCVPDADSSLGSSQSNAIGTCSLNRQIRCWDDATASEPRSSGGCDFGAGGDFGACQAPYEALVADYTTSAQDLQLALNFTECTDNASTSAHCETPLGQDIYIADMRTAAGTAFGGSSGASCAAGAGTTVQVGVGPTTAGGDFNSGIPFQNFYIGGSAAVNRVFPIKRGSMDGRGAGFENIGRMPANWLTRNSATVDADCLSASDIDSTDDETSCDTETLAGFSHSYNNLIGPNNLFFKASQAHGNKSAVVETFPSGGPNDFIGNVIDTHYRQTVTDWGEGNFAYNKIRNLSAWNTAYGFAACYSGACNFVGNEISNSIMSFAFQSVLAAQKMHVADTVYRNVSATEAFHYVQGGKFYEVEGEQLFGSFTAMYAKVTPGLNGIQKPTATFKDVFAYQQLLGTASNATTGGGRPVANIVFEADDTSDANPDDWKSVLIDNVNFFNDNSDSCLAWFEDDFRGSAGAAADTAALAREAASRVTIQNSSITGAGAAAIACTGQYEYTASVFDSNSPSSNINWSVEAYAPALINNKINNAPTFDMLPTISQASVGNADVIPHGTVVRVHDGAASCAHTGGDLDSGSAVVTCASDQAADTWTEWP